MALLSSTHLTRIHLRQIDGIGAGCAQVPTLPKTCVSGSGTPPPVAKHMSGQAFDVSWAEHVVRETPRPLKWVEAWCLGFSLVDVHGADVSLFCWCNTSLLGCARAPVSECVGGWAAREWVGAWGWGWGWGYRCRFTHTPPNNSHKQFPTQPSEQFSPADQQSPKSAGAPTITRAEVCTHTSTEIQQIQASIALETPITQAACAPWQALSFPHALHRPSLGP